MRSVIETIINQHDLAYVGVAALVCAVSAFSAIVLLSHARKAQGVSQRVWIVVGSFAIGCGIWATHFIGMLSFNPGMATGYHIGLTALSLGTAILFAGAGMWIAAVGKGTSDAVLGGVLTGIGISAMHFVGMASIIVGGGIIWDMQLSIAAIAMGCVLSIIAFVVGTNRSGILAKLLGSLFLTLAICIMHFTAMGAAGFENCFAIVNPTDEITTVLMPVAVAVVSLLILISALIGMQIELRDQRHSERETQRMRELANAAVEGLVVCDGETIITVNQSFSDLVGHQSGDIVGRSITSYITSNEFFTLRERCGDSLEGEIRKEDGNLIPVEMILQVISYGGKQQNALAIRDLSDRKKAEQRIRFLAMHDALTGLPNRTNFSQRLETALTQARVSGKHLAVLCLDLDRFKEVNDIFGHSAGDNLLQRVGACLTANISKAQFAARLGGDEFAIVVPDIDGQEQAAAVASRILEAFRTENTKSESGAILAGSIGIAVYPEHTLDAAHLMIHADTALYRAKQEGRGGYYFYREEMGVEVHDKRLLESELRQAIARNQLHLVYQPQVNINTNKIIGFEALARWDHPERGAVSPGTFIPLAEESGLILQIGEWALHTAFKEAASWKNPLSIAVNVSTVQLHNQEFPKRLQQLLHETGISPKRVELEITETALIKDLERALSNLAQLKALGVRIAMDDFGTGYSSLSNLRAFTFDKIKIDQSFIRSVDENEHSAAIVRAVLGLGRGLNLPVLVEGVERFEELEFLRTEVCSEVQGYFVGMPVGMDSFADVVNGVCDTVSVSRAKVEYDDTELAKQA